MFSFLKGVIQLAIFGAVITGGFITYFNYYGLPSSKNNTDYYNDDNTYSSNSSPSPPSSSESTYKPKLDYQQEVTFEDSDPSKAFVQNNSVSSNNTATQSRKSSNSRETVNKKKTAKKSYRKCDRLVMYSTTWCSACKIVRKRLTDRKIKYKDNVVDKNRTMNNIFERKMKRAGRSISYPTIEINGKIVNYESVQYYQNNYNLCKK